MNEKFSSLRPRIKGAAHNLARRYSGDAGDIEQDIILLILERYAAAPDFLNQSPKTVVDWACNRVGWQHRKDLDHARQYHVEDAPISHDPNAPTLIDTLGSNPWPQIELQIAVGQALSALSPRDRTIAARLVQGRRSREIGGALGVSHRAVCNRYPVIREAFAAAGV